MKKIFFFTFTLFLILAGLEVQAAMIVSTFTGDNENWTVSGMATLSHENSDGNPGGFLVATEAGGDTFEVVAPAKFLGNLSRFNGGIISFDSKLITSSSQTFGSGFGKVTIVGGGTAVELDLAPNDPETYWETYSAPLVASNWGVDETTWNKILADVTQIRVILESVVGTETMGFDNFKFEKNEYFVGNKCWDVHITERQGQPVDEWVKMRLHIFRLDGSTWVVQGTVDSPGDSISILTGNGARKGGKIYCNLVATHPHIDGLRDNYIYRLEFTPTTLNGSFWAFLKSYNTLTKQFVEDEYVAGELIATDCK